MNRAGAVVLVLAAIIAVSAPAYADSPVFAPDADVQDQEVFSREAEELDRRKKLARLLQEIRTAEDVSEPLYRREGAAESLLEKCLPELLMQGYCLIPDGFGGTFALHKNLDGQYAKLLEYARNPDGGSGRRTVDKTAWLKELNGGLNLDGWYLYALDGHSPEDLKEKLDSAAEEGFAYIRAAAKEKEDEEGLKGALATFAIVMLVYIGVPVLFFNKKKNPNPEGAVLFTVAVLVCCIAYCSTKAAADLKKGGLAAGKIESGISPALQSKSAYGCPAERVDGMLEYYRLKELDEAMSERPGKEK